MSLCEMEEEMRSGGLDLQEEEDHISPQVTITSSSSSLTLCLSLLLLARLGSEQLHLDQDSHTQIGDRTGRPGTGPTGSVFRLRAPVMLGTVKMEGHKAPDWSGYYSEEVGHSQSALPLLYRHREGVRPGSDRSGSGPGKSKI